MDDQGTKQTPERIGRYDVIGILGRGGMGVVYRGRDSRIGRDVAIKTLTDGFSGDPEMLKRFYKEAAHTGNLRHPNIVTLYDFGDEDGLPYIVMEFLDGEPLDKLIRESESLHLSAKLDIIEQVCEALAYAHVQGMIHRDVKPANVIVQRDGLVKLLDFGIARAGQDGGDKNVTRTGTLVGTPAYMAPERLRGELFDGRSDIFSAGVMLFQFVTGALPFDAEYPAILHQILNQDPPLLSRYLSGYPAQLDQVIARALEKKPLDRYSHAGDMAADLNAVGTQLKAQRVESLLQEAQTAMVSQNLAVAKQLLSQVIRLDSQHAEGKKLMLEVNHHFNLQKTRERVEQLRKAAEDAIEARNWDQASSACAEGLQLDASNPELSALQARAHAGRQAKEQIRQLLRGAESARHLGNFESAKELAGRAFELDPSDSRILAICKVVEQEAEEERRKTQFRSLLSSAQDDLSGSRLAEASAALAEAESLLPADAELMRLKDELAEAMLLEQRKQLVSDLEERSEQAITLEQLREAMSALVAALERFPAEPSLLRLKMQLDPRLRDGENSRLVAQVTDACSRLSSAEALNRIREALKRLPGNSDLLKLEAAIERRSTRKQREQALAEHLARARALLEDHLYLETVKVLELCEKEGYSSPELSQLLTMAHSAAAERVSQDLVERSFLEAKRLLEEQDYEEVLRMLGPVLQRMDEPALRKQMEEASLRQQELEVRVDLVVEETGRLCELGLFDAAAGFIEAEPRGVKQAKRVQSVFESCRNALESEASRLKSMGGIYAELQAPEGVAAYKMIPRVESEDAGLAGLAQIEERLGARLQLIAGQEVAKSIEEARKALSADDFELAESLLNGASPWLNCSNPALQSEWNAAQAETAAGKKILRFRKVLRR